MGIAILESFNDILKEKEFHHQKARELWLEWGKMNLSPTIVDAMLGMDYRDILASNDNKIIEIRDFLIKLIAYCDARAKDLNTLNEYEDNRTIARSGIYQNNWISQLLKLKKYPDEVSPSIRNLIDYFDNPAINWPILSEEHRKWIYEYLIEEPYEPNLFSEKLNEYFSSQFHWAGENPENRTCFITKSIYAQDSEWKMSRGASRFDQVKGLLAHDTDISWKNNLISEMSDGRKGCVWWNAFPARHKNEIISQLTKIIEERRTFDFYYIANNIATYRATVIDFATKDNYNDKRQEWAANDPASFENDFESYEDAQRSAKIVFLISKFEELHQPIPTEFFRTYRKMKYNLRGGLAAYSYIVSQDKRTLHENMDKIKETLKRNKNIILTGAPGTGKTYLAQEIAKSMGAKSEMVQFHPSYDYTDFVEGLRPAMNNGNVGFQYERGIFKDFCAKALQDYTNGSKQPYVFIIDEINRGDIAKIFGELFFSIDPNYRYTKDENNDYMIRTQYQNTIPEKDVFAKGFYVPNNVYIIGTMNDIDRGVETFDLAFRRRFIWINIKAADSSHILSPDKLGNLSEIAKRKMEAINNEIIKIESLSEDYQIGGAYFLKLSDFIKDKNRDEENVNLPFEQLWEYSLQPLLKEYLRGMENAKKILEKLKERYDGA